MIIEEFRNIKSGKEALRKFGITLAIVFSLLSLFFFWRGRGFYIYFLLAASLFLFSALLKPLVLKPVQKGWMIFGLLIAWFITRTVLIFLFYLVVTPIALLAKLTGKRFLDLKFKDNRNSYWIIKAGQKFEKSDYERQF